MARKALGRSADPVGRPTCTPCAAPRRIPCFIAVDAPLCGVPGRFLDSLARGGLGDVPFERRGQAIQDIALSRAQHLRREAAQITQDQGHVLELDILGERPDPLLMGAIPVLKYRSTFPRCGQVPSTVTVTAVRCARRACRISSTRSSMGRLVTPIWSAAG